MTPDQQKMWDTLRDEPYQYAIKTGTELQQCTSIEELHKKIDIFIDYLVATKDKERAFCTLRCWLVTFNIPMVPLKLKNFDSLHEFCGKSSKEKDLDIMFNKFMHKS
jgi:hypothetical protein